ncbi:mitochondrial phosphate carrier protein 3, mitochondrial [Dorcoceras hygrometricum]|uniref:Mitochondrial phosphate carrier protein 3, mitochondrial n=1 Tax=Dorcoceras hygrometricum TaxID=472368 RepID=A0A2Z7BWE4_9LAMI|nr:mitochondrial phosphate carrier protein 3, mitochondrial [Dorcoceras hygrometricum]
MYSPAFYAACIAGGILSCGLTHTAVTPLDLVKCNMQKYYSDIAGPEYAAKYKTLIYLAGSASAEVIADVALCPFEAVKVRVQTQPGFARGLSDGFPKFIKDEGALGLYKGIVPLWGRHIPYTMMKFSTFENIVEAIYKYSIPTPKDQCSKSQQLGIRVAGGRGATVGDAVNKLGLWGLCTRGLPLRIVMVGTLTGAQLGISDALKVLVGLECTTCSVVGVLPRDMPPLPVGPAVQGALQGKNGTTNAVAHEING